MGEWFSASVATPLTQYVAQVLIINALPAVLQTSPLTLWLLNLTATIDASDSPNVPPVDVRMTDSTGNLLCTATNLINGGSGAPTHSASCSVLLSPAKALAVLRGGGYTATIVPNVLIASVSASGVLIA